MTNYPQRFQEVADRLDKAQMDGQMSALAKLDLGEPWGSRLIEAANGVLPLLNLPPVQSLAEEQSIRSLTAAIRAVAMYEDMTGLEGLGGTLKLVTALNDAAQDPSFKEWLDEAPDEIGPPPEEGPGPDLGAGQGPGPGPDLGAGQGPGPGPDLGA